MERLTTQLQDVSLLLEMQRTDWEGQPQLGLTEVMVVQGVMALREEAPNVHVTYQQTMVAAVETAEAVLEAEQTPHVSVQAAVEQVPPEDVEAMEDQTTHLVVELQAPHQLVRQEERVALKIQMETPALMLEMERVVRW